MGLAVGDSGPRGEQDVTGRRYAPQNVAATIYHVLGIDPTTTLQDRNGRPIALLDDREKITELL